MTRLTRLFRTLFLCLMALTAPLAAASAQQGGPFAPRLIVNGQAITNWEYEQRVRFLQLLNSPGDIEQEAITGLIEDRLRMNAARDAGVQLTEEQVREGMTEFASRANLTAEEFVAELERGGVAAQSFRDFVTAGLAWREVVRNRFGPRAQITEAEIDRALALSSRPGSARVLLSEIILRADTPEFRAQARALAARLTREIETPAQFAAAARQYSVSGSAGRGGRIDWLDLSNLPPQIASAVLSLGPGEVSDPIPVPNAIALFQLRAIEETDPKTPETLSVQYARFFLPGASTAEAADVAARVDSCDDLYGVAKGLPEERLRFDTLPLPQVPADLALELAKLDERETATLMRGDSAVLLMLCGRTAVLPEDADRQAIRLQLFNQRLASYANSWLEELKADAIIRKP